MKISDEDVLAFELSDVFHFLVAFIFPFFNLFGFYFSVKVSVLAVPEQRTHSKTYRRKHEDEYHDD